MAINNDCRFIGNVTHPPHFQRVGESQTPFLRLYLAVDDGDDPAAYVRIVAYGDMAQATYPYLQVGSRLLIQARYRQRRHNGSEEKVHEFIADQIVFIDKIDWTRGDAARAHLRAAERT